MTTDQELYHNQACLMAYESGIVTIMALDCPCGHWAQKWEEEKERRRDANYQRFRG